MLAAALLMSVLPAAAPADGPQAPPLAIRTHKGPDGTTYQHILVRPREVKAGETYPLIVFLHGAGERGDDPTVLLKHFFPALLSDEYRERFPCYILAPQCPKEQRWGSRDYKSGEDDGKLRAPLAAAMTMVDAAIEEFPIDENRLYLTGLSMGGYGTWDWTIRNPGKFAAAAPICGGGKPDQAEALKDLPLWVVHGDEDSAVPVERSREMVAAVSAAGGFPIYVEYPGVPHDSWTAAYGTPDGLIGWLFRQNREGGNAKTQASKNQTR